MDIYFTPQRSDQILVLEVRGNVVIVNGEEIDGSSGTVTVTLPHGSDPTDTQRFPAPMLNVPNGVVDLSKMKVKMPEPPSLPPQAGKKTYTANELRDYNAQFRGGSQ
jgi:hypothetical protein